MNSTMRSDKHVLLAPLMIQNGRHNLLDSNICKSLGEAIVATDADPEVGAIVIFGAGTCFSAGVNLDRENNEALAQLCALIEKCRAPVIAALHGEVSGGGLELAMASDYRLALPGTTFSQPDINFGLVPSAGATQRLPRLAGLAVAAKMLLEGSKLKAQSAYRCGLVDAVLDHDDPISAAQGFFKSGMAPRPSSAIPAKPGKSQAYIGLIEKWRAQIAQDPHPIRAKADILTCLENATLLPFNTALSIEASFADAARDTPRAQALRYAKESLHKASAAYISAPRPKRPLRHIGFSGVSETGLRLIMRALKAGLHVTLCEPDGTSLNAAIDRVAGFYKKAIKSGAVEESQVVALLSALHPTQNLEDLENCDLVIDALPEMSNLRRMRLNQLGKQMSDGAVLASLNRYEELDICRVNAGLPGRFCSLAFTQSVPTAALLEVSEPEDFDAESRALIGALARRFNISAISAKAMPGRIVDPVLADLSHMAHLLVRQGASVTQVDAAMRVYGFQSGIFQLLDRLGLDRAALAERGMNRPEGWTRNAISARLRHDGELGRLTGKGYYIYAGGATGRPRLNPSLASIIEIDRTRSETPQRKFREGDIRLRITASLANSAARLLANNTVGSAVELDAAIIAGLGFPKEKGGIAWQVDQIGVGSLIEKIGQISSEDPLFWHVSPFLQNLSESHAKLAEYRAVSEASEGS